jgi:hypothetical protein
VQLAELDLLDIVQITSGVQYDEQRVVVPLELGALMGDDGVFDRELVQRELRCYGADEALIGSVEPDPRHAAQLSVKARVGLGQAGWGRDPVTVDVHGAVHDAAVAVGRWVRTRLRSRLGRRQAVRGTAGSSGERSQGGQATLGHGWLLAAMGVADDFVSGRPVPNAR